MRRSTPVALMGPDTVAQTVLPKLKDDAPVVQLDAKVETESSNETREIWVPVMYIALPLFQFVPSDGSLD